MFIIIMITLTYNNCITMVASVIMIGIVMTTIKREVLTPGMYYLSRQNMSLYL